MELDIEFRSFGLVEARALMLYPLTWVIEKSGSDDDTPVVTVKGEPVVIAQYIREQFHQDPTIWGVSKFMM